MTIDELEDYIEGYSNAFDENKKVKIICAVEEIKQKSLVFEEAFGTISYSAKLRADFSNPYNEEYLSSKVEWAIRGSASINLLDSMDIAVKLAVD